MIDGDDRSFADRSNQSSCDSSPALENRRVSPTEASRRVMADPNSSRVDGRSGHDSHLLIVTYSQQLP